MYLAKLVDKGRASSKNKLYYIIDSERNPMIIILFKLVMQNYYKKFGLGVHFWQTGITNSSMVLTKNKALFSDEAPKLGYHAR